MTWESWLIGISIAVIAAAFVVLVVFLALLLQSLRRTLEKSDQLLQESSEILADVEGKLNALDPYFHVAQSVGEAIEKKACSSCEPREKKIRVVGDVVDWALMGLSIWNNFREGRR